MRRLASTVLALAAFTLGCESATEPADEALAPSEAVERTEARTLDNFTNNLDGGGPHIFRLDDGLIVAILNDPETSLSAVHSAVPFCGGDLEPVDMQFVLDNPDDPLADRIRRLMLADPINIFVVDTAQPGDCFSAELVASGTGKLVNTDNDLTALLENNANAFGYSAHGTLTGPAGRKAHYSG
ncbi:MAG: hypothetical protein ACODAA_07055, partial [Gemmatimonadota bacterium]